MSEELKTVTRYAWQLTGVRPLNDALGPMRYVRETDYDALERERNEAADALERVTRALSAVNDVRNSIIGTQKVNWSEHVYPLVAALDAAGMKGMPYPEARENMGTLLERALAAESEVERLKHDIERSVAASAELTTENERLRKDAARIERIAATRTVENWLKLPDDHRRRWFALMLDESERKKAAMRALQDIRDTPRVVLGSGERAMGRHASELRMIAANALAAIEK